MANFRSPGYNRWQKPLPRQPGQTQRRQQRTMRRHRRAKASRDNSGIYPSNMGVWHDARNGCAARMAVSTKDKRCIPVPVRRIQHDDAVDCAFAKLETVYSPPSSSAVCIIPSPVIRNNPARGWQSCQSSSRKESPNKSTSMTKEVRKNVMNHGKT